MFHVKHSQDVQVICRKNGFELNDGMVQQLEQYVSLLLEWNAKVNLVSRKDQENIWGGHVLHALSMLFRIRLPEEIRVIDLGSGGGLPGIPLAIVNPGWTVGLLDSIQKKCTAVEDIVTRMGLAARVEVIADRLPCSRPQFPNGVGGHIAEPECSEFIDAELVPCHVGGVGELVLEGGAGGLEREVVCIRTEGDGSMLARAPLDDPQEGFVLFVLSEWKR